MKSWIDVSVRRNRLSYALLLSILLCSVVFTLLVSAFQLYTDYRKDMKKIPEIMALIEESYLEPLETSLWSFDTVQIEAQIRGILTLPLIKKVVVYEWNGTQEKQLSLMGAIEDRTYLEQKFTLRHRHQTEARKIGTLSVYAGLDAIGAQIKQKAFSLFLTRVIEILILSLFILLIFRVMILKHLRAIERFLGEVDSDTIDRKLVLDRRAKGKPDVLDSIVSVINRILHQLIMDISKLKQAEETLLATNQELVQNREMLEEQDRIRTAQVDVAGILREDQDIETLARRMIGFLCHRFKAVAGMFYHVDAQTNRIRAVAAYALAPSDWEGRDFPVGEGQVGQAVLDQQRRVLQTSQGHSMPIRASLGRVDAREILIYPFVRDGRVVGVVELASVTAFKTEQTTLLDQITESVAIAVESAVVRSQKARLIDEIQHTADALTHREKEFRRSEETFRILFHGLGYPVILTDPKGRVLDVNRVMLVLTGQNLTGVQGRYIGDAPWWTEKKQSKQAMDRVFASKVSGAESRQGFKVTDKDGQSRDLCLEFTILAGDSGEVWGMMIGGSFPEGAPGLRGPEHGTA